MVTDVGDCHRHRDIGDSHSRRWWSPLPACPEADPHVDSVCLQQTAGLGHLPGLGHDHHHHPVLHLHDAGDATGENGGETYPSGRMPAVKLKEWMLVLKEGWSFLGGSFLGKCEEMHFRIKRCGIKSGWSCIRWFLIRVISHQGGLSSGWSFMIRVVSRSWSG